MNAVELAIPFIKKYEDCRLKAYPDPGTGGDPWTIGFGSTGPGINPGTIWTQEQADSRFLEDVNEFAAEVAELVKVPTEPYQMAALISLAYNIGMTAFRKSTLLKLLNQGHYAEAGKQFPRWNRAGGRVMRGLTNRRNAEAALFGGII
jgi:lysozyme